MLSSLSTEPQPLDAVSDTTAMHANHSQEKDLSSTGSNITNTDNISVPEKTEAVQSDEKPDEAATDDKRYLSGIKLFLVFLGFMLSILLIALDQTIVATAQPKIVSQFNSLERIAWVSSAYFLTNAGLILPVGQIMTVCSTKIVYLASISTFELGSLLCGVAPSMSFLIFGRAIAGCGAAGIFVSILSIIAEVTKLEDRPMLFGAFGAVSAVASTVGPLLGGIFTDHVSWRWCFYINLPFGALAILTIVFFLHTTGGPKKAKFTDMSTSQKWLHLDFLGAALSLSAVTCLLLGLQWGGNTKPWNSPDVIAMLVLVGVLLALFVAWEWYLGDRAMLPLQLLTRRTQLGCCLEGLFIFIGLLMGTYYLPLWYQAKGSSASRSGINILGYMLSVVIFAALSGAIITKTGRYWPFLVLSPLIAAVGSGMLFTVHPDTANQKIIGFQILLGVGLGGALQNTIIAVQAEYAREEELIPQATSIVSFLQIVGGVIGITVGASVFGNQLSTSLARFAPELTPLQATTVRSSVTAIFTLPANLQGQVIEAYSYSLNRVFLMGVPASVFASLSALLIRNYNIKERSLTANAGLA